MRHEITFVAPSVSQADRELFLGPFDDQDGPIIEMDPSWTLMAHLLHHVGIFPSIKQAKNNGWDQPLPVGFDHVVVGKKKLNLYILTRFD